MRVIVLGAGTALPQRRLSPASVLIESSGRNFLFDIGPGTLQRLHAAGVLATALEGLFITHYHLDHCLDLATLLFVLRIPQRVSKRSLRVFGPLGLKTLYRRLNVAFSGWLTPKAYRLILTEWNRQASVRLGGNVLVRAQAMRHSATALGYRFESHGKSVAYSGDTDVCSNLIELARGVDLLLLECSHPDESKVAGHLTPTECGKMAQAAGCRHLVLTHFYPSLRGYDIRRRVQRHFKGPLTLARDFTSFRL